MKIPEPENTTANAIYKLYEADEKPRSYLGWSQIGHPCNRYLWLSFRWAVSEKIEGRIRRLFNTGHREEARVLSELQEIKGCTVRAFDPKTGNQWEVKSFGGHLSGHLDATALGIPEAPKTVHVVDVKTIKSKKFDELLKNGMEKSYPTYWAQAHGYMGKMNLTRAIFIFVCKDNDRIHCERVEYDEETFNKMEEKAKSIIFSDRMPEPLSANPSWYQCKSCHCHRFCHDTHLTENVNCRTCAHITPIDNGEWHCARYDSCPPVDYQYSGCESHVLHPDLVPWKRRDSKNEWEAVYEVNGKLLRNGEPDKNVFGSKELIANAAACASDDELLAEVRDTFAGVFIA